MRSIAFFDMDKTILSVNSATIWVRYELRNGNLRRRDFLEATGWLLRYRLGAADHEFPMRKSIATLAGTKESDIKKRCEHFFQTQLRQTYRPGALEAIKMHRQRGDHLVLLTSSTNYIADFIKHDLLLDANLCTRLQIDEKGLFTGIPIEPLSFGKGKLQLAHAHAKKHNIELNKCTFYSDSFADMPVFKAVGFPIAVNPDIRLRYQAKRFGWPIQNWGTTKKEKSSF